MSYQIRTGLWRPQRWAALVGLTALGLAGCMAGTSEEPNAFGPQGRGPDGTQSWDGAFEWSNQCASCHGDRAEGGVAPALSSWDRGRDALVQAIDISMPLGAPEACPNGCAVAVADYVLDTLQAAPISCDEVSYPPRQLRLLTRTEYRNTVRDLFAVAAPPLGAACTGLAQCDAASESCVDGHCAADPCGRYSFVYDAGGERPSEVVAAGSFNGWSARAAEGGWPLEPLAGTSLWVLKRDLDPGRHSYKIVVDGDRWLTDPRSPETEDDGFGGQNSVVVIDCQGSGGGSAPDLSRITDAFPVESRPSGYFYDNGAESGLVSSVHVTEYMAAAESLADAVLAAPEAALGCTPSNADCVSRGLRRLGERAFRRPLSEAEHARYLALANAESDRQAGLRVALRVLFSSPSFLYKSELGTPRSDGTAQLGAYEIASAMSYLFWASAPDAALLTAAAEGRLDTEAGRAAEARRLLEDPRAREVVSRFVIQWLGADKVLGKDKHPNQHPGFDAAMRRDLLEETRRFVEHVVFDGSGNLADLFVADFTFLNARLERFYGVSGGGGDFARATYGAGRRAGIFGHGSVLATYAHSDQSSPILRGVFVREHLLCQKFGTPPANAGGVPEVDPNATTRERFRQHSDDPSCRSCHRYIDEVGFGFERFDAVGGYRESENGQSVDGAGAVEDLEGFGVGTNVTFETVPELARIIADSEASKLCFAAQYWRFAHGRLEAPEDKCAIERLTEQFAASDFDIQALLVATVASPAFVVRQ